MTAHSNNTDSSSHESESDPRRPSDTWPVLKRLIGYMAGGDHRHRFRIAMALRIAAYFPQLAIPYFTGLAINVLSDPEPSSGTLRQWIFLAIAGTVAYLVISFIAEHMFSRLATSGLFKLQTHLFNRIQGLSLNFFDRQPVGDLMSRVTNDTETIALFFEDALARVIRSVFQILFIVIVMFVIEWQLTLIALLIVPVMLLLTVAIERISTPAFEKMQAELGDLSGFQEETISGQKVIIANCRQPWAAEANEHLSEDLYKVAHKAFFTSLLQMPLSQTMVYLQMVSVLFVGALMALEGETTIGVVIAFTGYVGLLASPLSEIANLTSTTLNAVAGGRRVFAIVDEEPQVNDAAHAKALEFRGGEVRFQNVDFSYVPGRKILRDNSFEAKPGEMIGICGPTGAGKSTIINILTRYYDIDSGCILIDGQDLKGLTQNSLRKQIGTVLQEAFLFSDTVMNNLKYAKDGATDEECIEAAKQANAHEFIERLPQGYDTLMTERGANLSQGQRQMITIARAMVADPRILVLDEATSNVDTRTEKLIQEGLQRLMSGRTSFVIAHRLSTIRNAHKILVVDEGRIVEQGPHDDLLAKKGFYYSLYISQFKGKLPGSQTA